MPELTRVMPGDPISALQQNAMIDRLNASSFGTGVGTPQHGRTTLYCKNVSGEDFLVGEPVAYKELISVTDVAKFNPREGVGSTVLESERITWHSNIANIGVVLDDTPDQKYGRIVIGGLAIVKLGDFVSGTGIGTAVVGSTLTVGNDETDDGLWATPRPDDTSLWALADGAGMARVIDKVNDAYALVQMGVSQPRWIAELLEDSNGSTSTTRAKLLRQDLDDFSAEEIAITDVLDVFSGYSSGYRSFVRQVGNRFEPDVGPCG